MARILGPTLTTDRLTLRPLADGDARSLTNLWCDFEVARMVSRTPHPFGLEDAEAFLACAAKADLEREVVFAVDVPDVGLVGLVGLDSDQPLGQSEIGYCLARPFWGQGLMTEAVRAVLAWVKVEWGRRFLMAGHFADNPNSGRVLTKAGFLYTGETRQRFSLARGETVPLRMMVWLA